VAGPDGTWLATSLVLSRNVRLPNNEETYAGTIKRNSGRRGRVEMGWRMHFNDPHLHHRVLVAGPRSLLKKGLYKHLSFSPSFSSGVQVRPSVRTVLTVYLLSASHEFKLI
jgi:hypothetical protein